MRRPAPWPLVTAAALTAALLAGCGPEVDELVSPTSASPDSSTPADPTTTTGGPPLADYPNDVVRYLQEALDQLGFYTGPLDGVFGDASIAAVRAFQGSVGLPETGELDAETALALAAASPAAQVDLVRALQTQLTELGLYRSTIDGDYGEGTREAVRRLQDAAGLPETGDMDEPTFLALQQRYFDEVVAPGGGPGTTSTTEPAGPGLLRPGSDGPEVQALQRRLAELGYRPGPADGRFGAATASAVLAFQKHEGLDRDQVVGPEVLARLEAPTGAGPRSTSAGPRLEVDLDRQVAFFVDAGGTVSILNISSGNGEEYENADGSTDVAFTPTGDYTVYNRVDDLEQAPLGTLYRPLYFVRGWAVHGSPSVPAYPASHGCIRASNADQDFIFPQMSIGAPISIYGTSLGNPERGAPGF